MSDKDRESQDKLVFSDSKDGIRTATLDGFEQFAGYFIEGSTIRATVEDGTTADISPDTVLYRGQGTDQALLPNIARVNTALETSDKAQGFRETEQLMLETFKREAVSYLDRVPSSEWEWIAIAQHHGLPTRLLDWTENPLMALWFAVANPPQKDDKGTICDGVLWEFIPNPSDIIDDRKQGDPFQVDTARVLRPTHVTARIRVQSSCFTVHGYIRDDGEFVPFEKLSNTHGRLKKLVIPGSLFATLRYILDQYGIEESVVFPDLPGLCSGIRWRYTRLDDEKGLEWSHKWRGWFPRPGSTVSLPKPEAPLVMAKSVQTATKKRGGKGATRRSSRNA